MTIDPHSHTNIVYRANLQLSPKATSTPKKSLNDSSIQIISPVVQNHRKIVQRYKNLNSRQLVTRKIYRKYIEEAICVFATHNTLPEVKKFFCCGFETKEEHVCTLEDCSWVEFCFKKIMNELDINFITHLSRERWPETFCEKREVGIALPNYDFYTKEGWLNEIKKKLKSYVSNQWMIW